MLLRLSFLSLIAITVIAAPAPADDAPAPPPAPPPASPLAPIPASPVAPPPAPDVSILTSIKFAGCSNDQTNILNQNVKDAVTLASAGLDYINDELVNTYPNYGYQQVDFSKQAAIDFFGPESQNQPYQQFIFGGSHPGKRLKTLIIDTLLLFLQVFLRKCYTSLTRSCIDALLKAADAYPGWGLSDWWNDRYVQLSCTDEANECKGQSAAYFYKSKHDYGYPLVVFCPEFFTKLPSHSDVVANIDGNKDLQQNLANMRSRATTFLHELLHINWGTAQECSGKDACLDHYQIIGNQRVRTYKTGRSKLLAQRNVEEASSNNDNFAYYAMAKFMEKRWKQYPKYPTVWDPTKSREENEDRDSKQPGTPPSLDTLDEEPDDGSGSPNNDPIYPLNDYPDWYQPLIKATFDDPTPDLTQPNQSGISYNGPDIKTGVTCETSDASPDIQDCIHAFGSLRVAPTLGALHGKKDGTWWAGVSLNSCVFLR